MKNSSKKVGVSSQNKRKRERIPCAVQISAVSEIPCRQNIIPVIRYEKPPIVVRTDAANFKAIVQRLTGNNSLQEDEQAQPQPCKDFPQIVGNDGHSIRTEMISCDDPVMIRSTSSTSSSWVEEWSDWWCGFAFDERSDSAVKKLAAMESCIPPLVPVAPASSSKGHKQDLCAGPEACGVS